MLLGLFVAGCSDSTLPTSANETQTTSQSQDIKLGPIGYKPTATVPMILPTVSVTASAETLYQSAGALQTVTFTGKVTGVLAAFYTVTDEYGIISVTNSLTDSLFSIPVDFPAIVDSNDTNGRQYVFTVVGVGTATVTASDTVVVAYVAPSTGGDDDNCGDHDGNNDHHGKGGKGDNDDHHGKDGKGNNDDHHGKDGKGNNDDHHGKGGKGDNDDHHGKGGKGDNGNEGKGNKNGGGKHP
jgi:hypothetical protein